MSPTQSQNDERRFSYERRQFHYSKYIPERRTGQERRVLAKQFQLAEPLETLPNLNFDDFVDIVAPGYVDIIAGLR
ncbi:MAG: hypothetical protein P8X96_06625 [Desulfobacteraceae bacterium]|jgi:hypothetical protein